MVELELLENRILREELINEERLEILDKVGEIVTLGNSEYSTIEQVAQYYKVGIEAIKSIVKRHKEELINNGYSYKKKSEILLMVQCEPIEVPNRGTGIFTKRAVLNIGMLLEISKVAEQVRTLLLDNHEQLKLIHNKLENNEKITKEDINKSNPLYFINKEKELRQQEQDILPEMTQAIYLGDMNSYMLVNCKLNKIKEDLISLEKERIKLEQAEKEKLIHTSKTYTSSELATELGFKSANAFNKELECRKIQYKVNKTWKLYSKYDGLGYTDTKQSKLENGTIIYNTRWTGEGRNWLVNTIFKDYIKVAN